jgi:hypothetical protein
MQETSNQNTLLRVSIQNSYRTSFEESERQRLEKLSLQRTRGTQVACVCCALSENPKFVDDDASTGTLVAMTAPRAALQEALHGDVILTTRPRNIQQQNITDNRIDLIHSMKHRENFETPAGFYDDLEIQSNRDTMQSAMRQRPASAYPFRSNDSRTVKGSGPAMHHSASGAIAPVGSSTIQRPSSSRKASAPPVVLKSTLNRIVPQTSAYLQWLKTSERPNKYPQVSATTQDRNRSLRISLASLPRVTNSHIGSTSLESGSIDIVGAREQQDHDIDLDSYNDNSVQLPLITQKL